MIAHRRHRHYFEVPDDTDAWALHCDKCDVTYGPLGDEGDEHEQH
jgi:hypothetical protein